MCLGSISLISRMETLRVKHHQLSKLIWCFFSPDALLPPSSPDLLTAADSRPIAHHICAELPHLQRPQKFQGYQQLLALLTGAHGLTLAAMKKKNWIRFDQKKQLLAWELHCMRSRLLLIPGPERSFDENWRPKALQQRPIFALTCFNQKGTNNRFHADEMKPFLQHLNVNEAPASWSCSCDSKARAKCHWPPFSQALMHALKVMTSHWRSSSYPKKRRKQTMRSETHSQWF